MNICVCYIRNAKIYIKNILAGLLLQYLNYIIMVTVLGPVPMAYFCQSGDHNAVRFIFCNLL